MLYVSTICPCSTDVLNAHAERPFHGLGMHACSHRFRTKVWDRPDTRALERISYDIASCTNYLLQSLRDIRQLRHPRSLGEHARPGRHRLHDARVLQRSKQVKEHEVL